MVTKCNDNPEIGGHMCEVIYLRYMFRLIADTNLMLFFRKYLFFMPAQLELPSNKVIMLEDMKGMQFMNFFVNIKQFFDH